MDDAAHELRKDRQREADTGSPELRRTEEWRTFLFLTVVMAPMLAVMVVGGYGFLVWISQMIAGPPGPM